MSLIDPYWHLNDNLIALSLASQAAEITERLTEPEHPIPELYDLICFILSSLDRVYPPRQRFLWYFVIHALTLLGWEPVLDRCAHCGTPVIARSEIASFALEQAPQSHASMTPLFYFSPSDGGILCPGCARSHNRSYTGTRMIYPLNQQTFNYLLKLSTARPSEIINIAIPKSVGKELSTALSGYLEWFLPVRLKSSQFLSRFLSSQAFS
jgi:recombinational DNA repair protein (RecF pathway)